MKKYRVITPWTGVKKGQIIERESISPMFLANVEDVTNEDQSNGNLSSELIETAQAEANKIIETATEEAKSIVEKATKEAEDIKSKADEEAKITKDKATEEAKAIVEKVSKEAKK